MTKKRQVIRNLDVYKSKNRIFRKLGTTNLTQNKHNCNM